MSADTNLPAPLSPVAQSLRRIAAMILRYYYLLRGSWVRILELIYWPTVQMLLWGFVQMFLVEQSSFFAQAFGILIGAVLLWDVLFRGQIGFSISFFEEIWSRNLGHLLVSPLRPYEFVLSLMSMSIIRTLIGLVPSAILAAWIFGFSLLSLGVPLAAFFFLLILFGWSIGLVVCGLVLRYGQGAESLAWALIFAIAPIAGVYYPISVLPDWLQTVSHALPPMYVFEGMRGILIDGSVDASLMLWAALLNVVWFTVGAAVFAFFYAQARERGILLQVGE